MANFLKRRRSSGIAFQDVVRTGEWTSVVETDVSGLDVGSCEGNSEESNR